MPQPRKAGAVFAGLTSALATFACASAQPGDAPARLHARPSLQCETATIAPGTIAHLMVTFDIDPGWHLYWPGQNDSGYAPKVRLDVPTGFKPLQAAWPAPKRLVQDGDILDHVYEKRLSILLPVAVPESAVSGSSVTLCADLRWLACHKVCVAEQATVAMMLPVTEKAQPNPTPGIAGAFQKVRAALPRPVSEAKGRVTATLDGSTLHITAPKAAAIRFYPADGCSPADDLLAEGERTGERLKVSFDAPAGVRVKGVVEIQESDSTTSAFWIDLQPVAEDAPAKNPASGTSPGSGK